MTAVLVTGGTGQIGIFLLPRLLRANCQVLALSRQIPRREPARPQAGEGRLCWIHPDDMAAESVPDVPLISVEALVSAGPIALAAALAARCPNLRRIVCFSSSSVLVKADSPDAAERDIMRAISVAEAELNVLCTQRGILLYLLRPTLIYGCGRDRNVSLLADFARRFRFVPVAGRASGLRQPVHADDLAALAAAIVTGAVTTGLESAVAGGDTLTFRDMVVRVFEAFGLRPRAVSLPPVLLADATRIAGKLFGGGDINAEMVLRQNRALVFDDSALRDLFGHAPRPFRPTAADFAVPPAAQVLQPR